MGAAEGELGRFAHGRRERISIATEFGIDLGGASRLARLQTPARALVARFPALRAALKRRDTAFHAPRRYDPAPARASLETSLRELGTDHVDLFLVHDPGPGDHVDLAELGETMEDLRRAGKIRAWGISGEPRPCVGLHEQAGADTVLQVHDEILSPLSSDAGAERSIAFGVIADPLARIQAHLAAIPQRRMEWSETLGVDCGDSEAIAALLLEDALDRHASVLFATGSPARLRTASAAARAFTAAGRSPALGVFRERIGAELGAAEPAHA